MKFDKVEPMWMRRGPQEQRVASVTPLTYTAIAGGAADLYEVDFHLEVPDVGMSMWVTAILSKSTNRRSLEGLPKTTVFAGETLAKILEMVELRLDEQLTPR